MGGFKTNLTIGFRNVSSTSTGIVSQVLRICLAWKALNEFVEWMNEFKHMCHDGPSPPSGFALEQWFSRVLRPTLAPALSSFLVPAFVLFLGSWNSKGWGFLEGKFWNSSSKDNYKTRTSLFLWNLLVTLHTPTVWVPPFLEGDW